MREYAVSTNLISFAPARAEKPIFGWPRSGAEAEIVATMEPGDEIVPKFAQWPRYREDQAAYQQGICDVLELDYEQELKAYNEIVAGGDGAVPFIFRVTGRLPDDNRFPSSQPWTCVSIELEQLPHPLSTQEFLRLRAIDTELARQFKATAAPGRHIQELQEGTVEAIRSGGQSEERADALRRFSLVWSDSAEEAVEKLKTAGRSPVLGDLCFVVAEERMLGTHEATESGTLTRIGEVINRRPADLLSLFEAAKARKTKKDSYWSFTPGNAIEAATELVTLIESPDDVLAIDDFSRFWDRYIILPRKVNQALEFAKRPLPTPEETADEKKPSPDEGQEIEEDELAAVQGLEVASVRTHLNEMELPDTVLAEAVTALRSGKHLLLSGPPGTGKSTIASALCRAVMDDEFDVVTATADWTTFDTIGGYLPTQAGTLRFQPGVVMRCLKRGRWLVIDELNRADIDKAFGPLFTLLAGTDSDRPTSSVVLPFEEGGNPIEIDWAETRSQGESDYTLTPTWRLIGTLNISDKASLFQLSFAFLRRFAVVDVPLPPEKDYRTWFEDQCKELPVEERDRIVAASVALAFGKRELGPAILKDLARFVTMGLIETTSGNPSYGNVIEAFLTAVRLYVVPQYEGAAKADTQDLLNRLKAVWPAPPERAWASLVGALDVVALK